MERAFSGGRCVLAHSTHSMQSVSACIAGAQRAQHAKRACSAGTQRVVMQRLSTQHTIQVMRGRQGTAHAAKTTKRADIVPLRMPCSLRHAHGTEQLEPCMRGASPTCVGECITMSPPPIFTQHQLLKARRLDREHAPLLPTRTAFDKRWGLIMHVDCRDAEAKAQGEVHNSLHCAQTRHMGMTRSNGESPQGLGFHGRLVGKPTGGSKKQSGRCTGTKRARGDLRLEGIAIGIALIDRGKPPVGRGSW